MKLATARKVLGAVFGLALATGMTTAHAAAPAVGTVIGNQATASYTDGGGNSFTATSGLVQSTVQQVAALTLTQDQTKSATQGQFVYFAHTLTNKGNGTDTFNLGLLNNAPGNLVAPKVFRDNNANGVVDVGDTEVTSIQLAAGAQAALIVQTQVTSAAGTSGSINLTATSQFVPSPAIPGYVAPSATNTDTVNVVAGAVINVLKGISVTSGGPGTEITYTLTYQNNGNAAATDVVLADIVPTGLSYVPGSGRVSTVQVLTDDNVAETNTAGVTYQYLTGRVSATIANVPVGATGTIQFKATVDAGVAAGVINNTGYYCISGGLCTVGTVGQGNGSATNTVPFTVLQAAGVVFNGAAGTTGLTDGEEVTVATAAQGATVSFGDWVHNTGNAIDKFNITVDSNTFPAGTSFQIFKSDGATPLLDTNGDGIIDTGDLPINGAYNIVVKAVLPSNAPAGGPHKVTLKATSVADTSKSDLVVNTLTVITVNSVDLTNGDQVGGAAIGAGATGTTVITTKESNAGASVNFPLWVYGGTVADTYNFSAQVSATGDAASKFSVAFYVDASAGHDGSVLGAQVADTGNIAPGGLKYFVAVVTTQAGTAADAVGNVDITVTGAATGATDSKRDQVTVRASHAISLNPDNAQQAFPGGNVIYTHTLANNGNIGEVITLTKVDTGGLSSVIYVDHPTLGTPGVFDANDTVYTGTISLDQGQSRVIFVTVAVPSNTPVGTSAVTTITATTAAGPNQVSDTATDTTSVVGGFIQLIKTGKNDVACDGTLTGTAATVKPNECLEYTVVATNIGSFLAEQVVINDVVPAYTTYSAAPAAASCATTGVQSVVPHAAVCTAAENGGAVSTTPVNLQPGQTVTLKFTVRVDPLAP